MNPELNNHHPLKMVAVHLGAGSTRDSEKSLEFAKMICEEVMLQQQDSKKRAKNQPKENFDACPECQPQILIDNQITAETAVVQLIQRMEDNQDLNCGLGSNLNIQGQVECDAGFMSDRTRTWCGVGALPGCRNPISLVKSLYDHRNVSRPLGLVQPNFLVGSGAKQWMREHCPHLNVADSRLISSKSFSRYQKLKSRYDNVVRTARQEGGLRGNCSGNIAVSRSYIHPDRASGDEHRSILSNSSANLDHGSYCISPLFNGGEKSSEEGESGPAESSPTDVFIVGDGLETVSFDTVGAIAVDCDNNFVSAVSSGGLLLKYKGRVGQAAVPGAGCWSDDHIAATTTGVGEYLTTTLFAKKFSEKIQTLRSLLLESGDLSWLRDGFRMVTGCIEETFEYLMEESALSHVPQAERLAGILAVSSLNSRDLPPDIGEEHNLYLSYGHNTETMCIGYMTCNDVAGQSIMSRREHEKNADEPLVRTITLKFD